jgi:riboflavin-specific deaminase-like protein
MQQLFPTPVDDVDALEVYSADVRPAPADRPWVMMNMISSADGGISVDGVSGGLGGPADKAVFTAIRGVADVILVASGTVLAENYRKPQTPAHVQAMRTARGQRPLPELAIVTGSLSIPADHRVFEDQRPMIVTHEQAPAERRALLADHAEFVDSGTDSVDFGLALRKLRERGAQTVLLEGGPTLNGHMASAGLVDELCLSLSPMLVAGTSSRIVAARDNGLPTELTLHRILHQDGLTFHRYTRR